MTGNDIEYLKQQQAKLHESPIAERPLQSRLEARLPDRCAGSTIIARDQ